jgi:hypothetical protein
MSIMRETGLPFENLMTGDDTCLVEARQRRAHRVRNLARIKVATAITVATFLSLLLLVNWERWGDALLALPTERTVWGTVSLYGPMLPDAIWEVMPIVIVLAWSWGESWLLWGRMAREAAALSKRRGAGLGIRTIIARLVLRLSAVGLLVLWWRSGDRGTALLAQWDDSISRISAYLASFRSLPTAQFETSLRFDPTSVDSYAKLVELWGRAIKSPEQLLATPFTPTWQQLTDAFEFYVLMLVLSALMYGFIVLFLVRGGLLPYLNSSARGVLSLVTAAAVAMALHLAFVWLGGRASFYGTAAAYIYGIAPYLPLASMTAIIMVWAMPASRRLDAMNSRTTSVARQKAMQEAMQNPETSKGLFLVGSLLFVALWALNLFAIFRALSYAHGLGGMALAGAVLLSLPMTALAGLLVQLAANGLGRILLMNAPSSMARHEAAAQ